MLLVLEWVLKALWAAFCFLFEFLEIFFANGWQWPVLDHSEGPRPKPMRVQWDEEDTPHD